MRLAAAITFVALSAGVAQAQINCTRDPNATAKLTNTLSDYERSIRELRLPKETEEKLIRQARETLGKTYDLNRKLEDDCEQQRRAQDQQRRAQEDAARKRQEEIRQGIVDAFSRPNPFRNDERDLLEENNRLLRQQELRQQQQETNRIFAPKAR